MTSDIRRSYHNTIQRLIFLARKKDALTSQEAQELAKIEDEHGWDGLSCACGGGWLVGHRDGCPEAPGVVFEECVERALHGRVPGGSEVWVWIDQRDPFKPSENARDVICAALKASGLAVAT